MADLVWFAFSTGGVIVCVLVGALWLVARPASRGARRLLLIVAIFYTAVSIYGISWPASLLVSTGYHPFTKADVKPGRVAVVVLGSGSFTARDWDENPSSIPDPSALSRALEAVRVYKLIDAAVIISSGGLASDDDTDAPTGVTMQQAMLDLGVPAPRLVVETESRDTHGEAVVVARMLPALMIEQVVVVTSRLHMRRAIGTFRAQGVDVVPAIARHPYTDVRWDTWTLPSAAGLQQSALIAHELLGVVYYRLRGWYRSSAR